MLDSGCFLRGTLEQLVFYYTYLLAEPSKGLCADLNVANTLGLYLKQRLAISQTLSKFVIVTVQEICQSLLKKVIAALIRCEKKKVFLLLQMFSSTLIHQVVDCLH